MRKTPAPEEPHHPNVPRSLRALPALSYNAHRALVLVLTFLTYTLYHATRKLPRIVKRELARSWPPFADPALLGATDVAFLTSYSLGMFAAGHLGDRFDLRRFLTFGMVAGGAAVALFGLGFFLGLHSLVFYVVAREAKVTKPYPLQLRPEAPSTMTAWQSTGATPERESAAVSAVGARPWTKSRRE